MSYFQSGVGGAENQLNNSAVRRVAASRQYVVGAGVLGGGEHS